MDVIQALFDDYTSRSSSTTEYKTAVFLRDRAFSEFQESISFDFDSFDKYITACDSVTSIEIEEAFLAGIRAAMKLVTA